MSTPFAHLHCHSHYSLLDGAGTIPGLLERTKKLGMTALALTDHGNLHGALKFYQKARSWASIRSSASRPTSPPAAGSTKRPPAEGGQLSSDAAGPEPHGLPQPDEALVGCLSGRLLFQAADRQGAAGRPQRGHHLPERLCFQRVQPHAAPPAARRPRQKAIEIAAWFATSSATIITSRFRTTVWTFSRLAWRGPSRWPSRLGIPLVATSDVHYVRREDADAQDILLCINTGKFRTDTNRMRMETNEFYSAQPGGDVRGLSRPGRRPAAHARKSPTASTSSWTGPAALSPSSRLPEGKTSEEFLRELCLTGLKERYAGQPRAARPDGRLPREVMARLERELDVIGKLGFANYFLIVWDFVRFARQQGIAATARGSGVGSLVSYALHLSHVCPLEYDLLFERFLDESRRETPDIDIDFCQHRRGEVIQYVKEKYGAANVAQIGTFGTLAARAAIRDVGRAMGLPIPRVNAVVAMVPEELGITLDKALEKSDQLQQGLRQPTRSPQAARPGHEHRGPGPQRGHARRRRGDRRPALDRLRPAAARAGQKKEVITQWAMGDVERAGLLKMDFLGLRNLTILSKVVELIEQTTGKRSIPTAFRATTTRRSPCSAAARPRACSSWKAAGSATSCSG